MEQISYDLLERRGYDGYLLKEAPERVLQFGEGNFLRAFVDYFLDVLNERAGFRGKAVLVQPIPSGLTEKINRQEGLYTLLLRGNVGGQVVNRKRVISSISRCIDPYADYDNLLKCAANPQLRFLVSNTTEAGIVYDPDSQFDDRPPHSFPAKVTRFLYERYKLGLPGFVFLACELIDHNGEALRGCVERYILQWGLGDGFAAWVREANIFCSTLVDRIVTGYPRTEAEEICRSLGYWDELLDTGEVFGFWAIEGPESLREELPVERACLPIVITADHTPYKQRKVRILNGAHTAMVMAAYLAGKNIVRDCMHDAVIRGFMNKAIYSEIIPTLTLPRQELLDFADSVTERFANPFIDHALLAITLNSTAKWRARVMPSLLAYWRHNGTPPTCLTFSLAAYIAFYHRGRERTNDALLARRGENVYSIQDDAWVLDFFYAHRNDSAQEIVEAVVHNVRMWGAELGQVSGLERAVTQALEDLEKNGAYEAMRACL